MQFEFAMSSWSGREIKTLTRPYARGINPTPCVLVGRVLVPEKAQGKLHVEKLSFVRG